MDGVTPSAPRAGLVMLVAAAGCAPPSQEAVERLCADRATAAAAPRGAVGVELASDGASRMGIGLSVSHDYLAGRDPDAVYRDCMARSLTRDGAVR